MRYLFSLVFVYYFLKFIISISLIPETFSPPLLEFFISHRVSVLVIQVNTAFVSPRISSFFCLPRLSFATYPLSFWMLSYFTSLLYFSLDFHRQKLSVFVLSSVFAASSPCCMNVCWVMVHLHVLGGRAFFCINVLITHITLS